MEVKHTMTDDKILVHLADVDLPRRYEDVASYDIAVFKEGWRLAESELLPGMDADGMTISNLMREVEADQSEIAELHKVNKWMAAKLLVLERLFESGKE